ncbi:hypothetical protein WUBG_13857, partial [Wuchereria bancrofti]
MSFQFMTDGILLREFMSDPLLTQYSILMVDEAHERSINTDIILGLLRKVIMVRQDLRIIVSSATLDVHIIIILSSLKRMQTFVFSGDGDTFDNRNGPLILEDRLTEERTNVVNNPFLALSIQQQRARLPIFKYRNHIIYLLEKYRILIIIGETGCGKSTQVPQYLMEAGWASDGRKIGVTQPRRIAAVTLASRVAEEKSCKLGEDVGYVVRFDDMTDSKTKIKFMTDGILLREFMSDPLLTQYSILMVDEAHERSINTDIILGLLRKVIM